MQHGVGSDGDKYALAGMGISSIFNVDIPTARAPKLMPSEASVSSMRTSDWR